MINRRAMLTTTGRASLGGLLLIGPLSLKSCPSKKNLSVYVQTIVGALEETAPLLPSAKELISKAVGIAKTFDAAYQAGNFDSAGALFENLTGVIGQIVAIATDASTSVKIALAIAGIAMRAIAVLLKSQEAVPEVAEARTRATATQKTRIALVDELANAAAVNRIFAQVFNQ